MKKIFIVIMTLMLVLGISVSGHATLLFSDNFNDGNANGWSFYGPTQGNWTVVGGVLHHDGGYTGMASYALIDSIATPSHFALEADVTVISNIYGDPDYGHVGLIWGVNTSSNNFNTSYLRTHSDHVTNWSIPAPVVERFLLTPGATNGTTYHMRTEVDYLTQTMKVTLGSFTTTFTGADFDIINKQSGGGIGLISWSDHVTYDNVVLTSNPSSVPEPATLLLLGSGLAGIGVWRKRIG